LEWGRYRSIAAGASRGAAGTEVCGAEGVGFGEGVSFLLNEGRIWGLLTFLLGMVHFGVYHLSHVANVAHVYHTISQFTRPIAG